MTEKLTLRYVPLSRAKRWDRNPKLHSLDDIEESIRRRGFRDPPAFDATLGALVEGNGRAEVLERMHAAGKEPPRGIAVDQRNGAWRVPVLFGIDAESVEAAEAYAVDHNSLALGPGFDEQAASALFDEGSLASLLGTWPENGSAPLVLDVGGLFSDVEPLSEMPDLPTGDREPFQQMTFTVSDEQAETIREALKAAQAEPFGPTGNDNSNGNALARLAEAYLG